LKRQLFFRPNTTVIDVPFRVDRDEGAAGAPGGGPLSDL
jgi:hypothetical protein